MAKDVTSIPSECTPGEFEVFGTQTDTAFTTLLNDSGFYFTLESADAKTISLWSDSECTTPLAPSVRQDEATNKKAYLEVYIGEGFSAIASGWSTYNPTTGAIDATELLGNINVDELIDTATNPLIQRSLNTTVPGRFVIGQRDGGTVTDPDDLAPPAPPAPITPPAPELADTGTDGALALQLSALAGALLLAGALTMTVRRRRAV